MKPKVISARHKWPTSDETQFQTDRHCPRCGIVRRTRHEPGELPWIEWYRDDVRIVTKLTPACDARLELAATAAPVSEPA